MIQVEAVQPGSIAEELGIRPGTTLLSVDGHRLTDFLDWEFLTAEEEFLLHVRHPDGEEIEYEIERDLEEPLGAVLEPPRIRRCANRCDFCFVDGLPEGLREVLYIRDDDYRLSFRYGNFATLTNLKPWDTDRIIAYHLSPLYVSVHATDPVVRRFLLRNPDAPDILEQLGHFAAHDIQFHTQVVMSPAVNDGEILRRTLSDLWDFGDAILSVSVVPVGLTEFSKHHLVREPTVEECRAAVELIAPFAERARETRDDAWVYGADELYLRAELELPPAESYGSFDQVENGVGSVRFLQQQIRTAEQLPGFEGRRIGVCTGTSMGALMPQVLEPLRAATGATFELMPLTNTLFGSRVTTGGLLPGRDFLDAIRNRNDLDLVLLPGEALNDHGRFIDDLALTELQAGVPMPVWMSKTFVDVLVEEEGGEGA